MQKLSHNKRPHPIKKLSEKEIKKKEEHAKAVARPSLSASRPARSRSWASKAPRRSDGPWETTIRSPSS